MDHSDASIVRTETINGCLVARVVCPHVGQREAPILQSDVLALAPASSHKVAIDFSSVTMLGSLGLGTLISLTRECRAHKGDVVLFSIDQPIRELIKMSRLDRVLKIKDDERGALKALS